MPYHAEKYQAYARECLRQADAAESETKRQKLRDLARVWTQAALMERTAQATLTERTAQAAYAPVRA